MGSGTVIGADNEGEFLQQSTRVCQSRSCGGSEDWVEASMTNAVCGGGLGEKEGGDGGEGN